MTLSELRLDRQRAWCGEANVLPRDCGWYCDGHTLLRAACVKRPKPYMARSTHDVRPDGHIMCRVPRVPADGVQRILNGCAATDGEPWTVDEVLTVPNLPQRSGDLPPAMVVLQNPDNLGDGPVYLDAHKVKLIAQLCGVVEYRVVDRHGPVRLVKNGELIGLIMPLRA